jgi:hypothetical protein
VLGIGPIDTDESCGSIVGVIHNGGFGLRCAQWLQRNPYRSSSLGSAKGSENAWRSHRNC